MGRTRIAAVAATVVCTMPFASACQEEPERSGVPDEFTLIATFEKNGQVIATATAPCRPADPVEAYGERRNCMVAAYNIPGARESYRISISFERISSGYPEEDKKDAFFAAVKIPARLGWTAGWDSSVDGVFVGTKAARSLATISYGAMSHEGGVWASLYGGPQVPDGVRIHAE